MVAWREVAREADKMRLEGKGWPEIAQTLGERFGVRFKPESLRVATRIYRGGFSDLKKDDAYMTKARREYNAR